MAKLPPYHILDFFHDEEDSCALTILTTQTRFHVIADVNKLRGSAATKDSQPGPWQEYSRLLSRLKTGAGDEEEQNLAHESRNQSADSAIDVREKPRHGDTKDEKSEADPRLPACQGGVDVEKELHEWLLAPLASIIRERSKESDDEKAGNPRRQTLEDWYRCKTFFFSLQLPRGGGKLEAVELESSPDLQDRMSKLRPSLTPVPKYIRDIDVAWYSASDLELVRCSESPPPYHPSIVELVATAMQSGPPHDEDGGGKNKTKERPLFFFKTVDNLDTQPTKREIKLLHQIVKKGLHDKIKCPRLVGIVTKPEPGSSNSNNRGDPVTVMGFLQTLIPDPTSLTEKFDSGVPQARREEWARRAEDMKNVLHENGIIWGDAKGDNFVVDAKGELWIIDFGGSYTAGWVDPDIVETRKGDDMGVEKTVNALRDPEENVVAPSVEEVEENDDDNEDGEREQMCDDNKDEDRVVVPGDKRKKSLHDEKTTEREDARQDNKRSRRSTSSFGGMETEKSTVYCYCGEPSAGTMIGCDGQDCAREWFHLECANLESLPKEEEAWYCRDCKA